MAHYGEDLTYVHASGFSRLAEIAADRLLEEVEKGGDERGLVVDLGCGPGISAARLTAAGFDVIGVDSSPAMIALARKTVPRATFEQASFVSYEIPPCDAVIAVGEVFNYLFDKANTRKALERVFARVFKALWPGGIFLFDMAGPGRVPGGSATTSVIGDDWGLVCETVEDAKKSTLTRTITILRKAEKGISEGREVHRQRLMTATAVLDMLRNAGFKARSLQGYDGERFAPGHNVFLARRP